MKVFNASVLVRMFFLCVLALTAPQALAADKARQSTLVNLQVDGMYSPSCPRILQSAVRKIDGVHRVEASLETHSATVAFDADKTTVEQIQRIIRDQAGFDTSLQ